MIIANRKAGPAFPFGPSATAVLGPKTRRESISTSISLILMTPKGSIIYNPNLGSLVPYLVFDPIDDALLNLLHYYIVKDLEDQETRIKVNSVSVIVSSPNKVTIWIGFYDVDDEELTQRQAPISFLLKEA